jgi:hypothetical protein
MDSQIPIIQLKKEETGRQSQQYFFFRLSASIDHACHVGGFVVVSRAFA